MSSAVRSLKRSFIVPCLALVSFALSVPAVSLSQDAKKEETAAASKTPPATPAQKGGAACGKTTTQTQMNGIAAKLREFQAKQQAKKDKSQKKESEQAANRKP